MAVKKPHPDDTPRKYHVVLANGSERTVTAARVGALSQGALLFENANDDATVIYAAGQWLVCELETKDE